MKSYNDTAKQLSREKELDFISQHLRNEILAPHNIKVVCLESEELLEIINVFDKLGVPRKNIRVIERNEEIAKRIYEKGNGVWVYNYLDHHFFATTREQFDIISLDYTGKKNQRIIESIRLITGRKLLKKKGILIINTFSARENREKLFLMPVANMIDISYSRTNDKNVISENECLENALKEIETFNEGGASLESSRDSFTDFIIANIFDSGSTKFTEFNRLYPQVKDTDELIKQELEKMEFSDATQKENARLLLSANLHRREMCLHLGRLFGNSDYRVTCFLYYGLRAIFEMKYKIDAIERYKYISSNGAPMEFDLYAFSDIENQFSSLRSYFYLQDSAFGGKIMRVKSDKIRNSKKWQEIATNVYNANFLIRLPPIPERVFLGSSAKNGKEDDEMARPKKVEKQQEDSSILANIKPGDTITKEQAIELLDAGWTAKQIAKIFKGFTKMQIAAFKAHITMGTYQE
ncbi:hypothetical protein JW977_02860 [Candidatus Falkowbacteria bacterium]|nr:hypothetical protein [Candidatus Falkowbacteria bacterium]